MTVDRFPLAWPSGWPRTAASARRTAKFNKKVDNGRYPETKALSVADATERLQRELDLLGARYVTLSTNMELRLDGRPRSDRSNPADPGAAVYFQLKAKPIALACDRWDRVADNIAALAAHIEALRGIDRWGVGTADQAFAGYQALPAPDPGWQVLGVDRAAPWLEVERAYRARAKTAHPDAGGSRAEWDRLQAAFQTAMTERGE